MSKIVQLYQSSGTKYLSLTLAIALYNSCIAPWDTDTFMIIGGCDNNGCHKKVTYFVFTNNETITTGPELKIGRNGHACNEIVVGGQAYVIVAGGQSDDARWSSEVLSKSSVQLICFMDSLKSNSSLH